MEKEIYQNYIVTSDGNVYSKRRKMFLKSFLNTKKYPCIDLPNNKSARIHRLVAEAFIPNLNNLPQVNHIDGNKNNNCISNLEWCDNRTNSIHRHKSTHPGVVFIKENKYYAKIHLNRKQVYLGVFKTLEEASLAYSTALAQYKASCNF
jgi:hypothetical protein